MSNRTADLAHAEWSHRTVLDCRPPGALAEAAVRHYLVAHRHFHVVDVVSMAAVKLASHAVLDNGAPLTLTLSEVDAVVVLRVDNSSASWAATQAAPVPYSSCGSVDVGLLTLRWGVSSQGDAVTGLWATVDARRHRDALLTIADTMSFAEGLAPESQARESA